MNEDKILQYKQIDFLRLFKLCRELGIVQRKRKMPTQYDRSTHINSSCSKLFKSFLTGTFEDSEIRADARNNSYVVPLPVGAAEKLRFVNSRLQTLRDREDCQDVVRRFRLLTDIGNLNFIRGPLSYNFSQFLILVIPHTGGRYQSISANLENRSYIARPREEYYQAAKSCLAFKALWNEHVGPICSFVDRERESIEQRENAERTERERLRIAEEERAAAAQRQRQEQARIRREAEAQARETQRRLEQERRAAQAQQVVAQAQQAREQQLSRAQELFNRALTTRQGR